MKIVKNKVAINTYLSKITLNVNGLNAPIKRDRIAEWMSKKDPHIVSPGDPPQNERHTQTKINGMEKDISLK